MAWCYKATDLKNRPRTDGKFLCVPPSLLVPSLMDNMLHSLTKDWQVVVSYFRSATMRKPKNGNSLKTHKFGRERVILYSQPFRKFHLNYLLETTLFGSPSFSSLHPCEIAHRTADEVIIHIASFRRLNQLLTFGGLSAFSFVTESGVNYGCCVRVKLLNIRGQKNSWICVR